MPSTAWPATTGVATASTEPSTLHTRKEPSSAACGRANPPILRRVAKDSGRRSSGAWVVWYSACHAVISMLMERAPTFQPETGTGAGEETTP